MSETPFCLSGAKNLYGEEGLERLQKSHVIIVGIGGVGSWTAEALIRTGVQKLTLIDGDEICITNLNRQIHTTAHNVGALKVLAMKERLLQINPQAEITCVAEFITAENVEALLDAIPSDFIFDAIDGLKEKCHLINYARMHKRNLLTVGGAGNLLLPERISIKDLNHTCSDPLLMRVRKKLRADFDFPRGEKIEWGIPALFTAVKRPTAQAGNCQSGLGTSAFITGTFGFWAAAYIAREISRQ